MGKVVSINISKAKGTAKKSVSKIELVPGLGVMGDAHAGPGERQVSLLMSESIEEARNLTGADKGCEIAEPGIELGPGSFAENITTKDIDLLSLTPGQELVVGESIRLRVTRIGKECHRPCAIYYKLGGCIMPGKGIFCEVLQGGVVRPGDRIEKR